MYNGIGLTTPRGSGTSGYVVRNLSSLRVHERNNDKSAWDTAPPKHREPDEAILEHERKRKVEVKCLELQDALEEKGIDEEIIEKQVDELRQKLLANLSAMAPPLRGLRPSDTHGMAAAKKVELSKMARAFGTRADYQEGEAFDREKQEENKIKRIAEREERERAKLENRAKMAEQKAKWEEERRERDKQRRKEEEKKREERSASGGKVEPRDMPPPSLPTGPRREYRDRDTPSEEDGRRSPPRRGPPRDDYRGGREVSPPHLIDIDRPKRTRGSPSRSRSPPPKNRRRVDSRSPSRSPSRSRSRSLDSRSRSPAHGASRRSRSRSVSPMRIVPPTSAGRPPQRSFGGGAGSRGGPRGRPPSRLRSRSPPRRRSGRDSRSRSRSPSRSRSRSPARVQRPFPASYRSGSPPPPSRRDRPSPALPTPQTEGTGKRGPPLGVPAGRGREKETGRKGGRSRSASTGSSMSVSTRSDSSGSRSRGRSRD